MPVEIRELIIRAVVADDDRDEPTDAPDPMLGDTDREAVVQECVRQVLRILERSRER